MTTINTKIADAAIQHQVDLLRVEAGLRRDVLALMETLSGDLAGMLAKAGAWDGETIPRKLKRLQGLKGQADGLIGDLYGKLEAETTTEMRDGAKYAAEWVPATINAAVGANVAGITLTTEVVTNLVKNTLVEGAPSAQWWGRQSETLKMDFMREMRMGILQGENLSDLTRRIRGRQEHGYADGLLPPKKDEFGKVTRQASTKATRSAEGLALTSVQQVMADSRMEAYRQNNDLIKGVQQLSTLDGRTSLVCRTYDHAAWDLEGKPLPGFPDLLFNGGPPRHWRCRSVCLPILRSWEELGAKGVKEFPPGTRASMDGQVADTLDYSTWLKSKPEAFQREVLGKGRYELWREGKAELKDMVDQRGRPVRVRELASGYVPDTPLGKSLAKTEAEIVKLKHEKGLVFDGQGALIFERDGAANHVTFNRSELQGFKGMTLVHNHPNGSPFSKDDIRMAAIAELAEIRAVGEQYVYSMKTFPAGWTEYWWQNRGRYSFDKIEKEVMDDLNKWYTEGVLTQAEANSTHRKYHEIWKRFANKEGLIYERTER